MIWRHLSGFSNVLCSVVCLLYYTPHFFHYNTNISLGILTHLIQLYYLWLLFIWVFPGKSCSGVAYHHCIVGSTLHGKEGGLKMMMCHFSHKLGTERQVHSSSCLQRDQLHQLLPHSQKYTTNRKHSSNTGRCLIEDVYFTCQYLQTVPSNRECASIT